LLAWRQAAMAATISTRCMTWPPRSFPSALVCAGSTTSAISEAEALTGFPCISTPSLTTIFPSRVRFMIVLVCASHTSPYDRGRCPDGPKEKPWAEMQRFPAHKSRRRLRCGALRRSSRLRLTLLSSMLKFPPRFSNDGRRPSLCPQSVFREHAHCMDSRRMRISSADGHERPLWLFSRRTLLPCVQRSSGVWLCGFGSADRLAGAWQPTDLWRFHPCHSVAASPGVRRGGRADGIPDPRIGRPEMGHLPGLRLRFTRTRHSRQRQSAGHECAGAAVLDGLPLRSASHAESPATRASSLLWRAPGFRPAEQAFHGVFSRRTRCGLGADPGTPPFRFEMVLGGGVDRVSDCAAQRRLAIRTPFSDARGFAKCQSHS